MGKSIVFKKSYTRDTTLIMQQLWFRAFTSGINKALGIQVLVSPFGVDYVKDGAIEIWESIEAEKFVKDLLTEKSFSETGFLKKFLLKYETNLADFKIVWDRGSIGTLKELLSFIGKIEEAVCGDLVLCYLSGKESAQQEVRDISERLRASDHFFASNDSVIRESLRKIFPDLQEYVTCIRLEELSTNVPSLEECRKRFENFVVVSSGYCKVETLSQYQKKHPYFVFAEERVEVGEGVIKGRIALKGKVRGRVKILRSIKDVDKVQERDIVVSPMTTPSFLPALIKACAIVTDEGGTLCHAAIVAREMKKPCIIGTKIATKVLKDGDLVEVDAEKGIVTIIKS